ncbi:MAG: hypothetical protein IT436_16095 [Phycisphaerales bacterium]|nr:hypothetical protein [Phycisphaerales bacterium]
MLSQPAIQVLREISKGAQRASEVLARWASSSGMSAEALEKPFREILATLTAGCLIEHDWSKGGDFTVWITPLGRELLETAEGQRP